MVISKTESPTYVHTYSTCAHVNLQQYVRSYISKLHKCLELSTQSLQLLLDLQQLFQLLP